MTGIDRLDQVVELLCGVGDYRHALTMRDIANLLGLKKTPYLETIVAMAVGDNKGCIRMDWRTNEKNREARYYWGIDQRKFSRDRERQIFEEYDHWYKMTYRQPPTQNKREPREDWQVG